MNALFLDSSYLLALELRNDQNHESATQHWSQLAGSTPGLVTTSFVFAEVVTYLNNRRHHAKAVLVGKNILSSPSVRLIHVDEALFRKAWDYFQQHRDKDYSLTDCATFVIMKELGITKALTFDQHFRSSWV